MLSPKERIQRQVLNRDGGQRLDFFGWADVFMNEYKMSFNEFKELKIPTANALAMAMEERYNKQNRELDKAKHGRGKHSR